MTTTLAIERDNTELFVKVEFEYSRPCRGKRDRFGVPLEPDYPASMEYIGCEIDLSANEIEKARNQAWEELNDARIQF